MLPSTVFAFYAVSYVSKVSGSLLGVLQVLLLRVAVQLTSVFCFITVFKFSCNSYLIDKVLFWIKINCMDTKTGSTTSGWYYWYFFEPFFL